MKRLLPIALAVMALAAFARSAESWDDQADKRKAEYIFLESQNAFGRDEYDAYMALSKRAFELDSADLDIGASWAAIEMAQTNDSATFARAYARLKARYVTDPSNFEAGAIFASVARKSNHYDDYVRTWEMLDSAYPSMTQPAQELAEAYLIASLLGDTAKYAMALDIYDRLEGGMGKTIMLTSFKNRAYLLHGDTAMAIKAINELVEHAPKDSYVAMYAGDTYAFLKDTDSALRYYDLACRLDSANGAAYMQKANLYSQLGDSLAFDREVFKALRSQNLEVEPKLDILKEYVSRLYTDSTQEQRIRRTFEDLEQMHSGEPEIHTLYSSYLYEIDDYAGAAEQMNYATALDPSNEKYWAMEVQSLAMAADTLALIDKSRQAMKRFPASLYFPTMAATGENFLGHTARAIDIIDSIDTSQGQQPFALSEIVAFKGDLYTLMGDTATALATYEKALELNPDNYMALNNAAYFMAENGIDLDKAERYSSKAVRNNDNNATFLDTYAWVLFKKKDYTLAKQYIDMTLNLYGVGPAAESADSTTAAAAAAAAAAFSNVSDKEIGPEIYEHAGDIYFMCQEPQKALEYWEKAAALDPDNKTLARKVKHRTYFFSK